MRSIQTALLARPQRVFFLLVVVAAFFTALGLDTVIQHGRAYALPRNPLAFVSWNPACTQLTVSITEDGTPYTVGTVFEGQLQFTGPVGVTISSFDFGCGTGGTTNFMCDGSGSSNNVTLNVSGNLAALSTASNINWTHVDTGIPGSVWNGLSNGNFAQPGCTPAVAPPPVVGPVVVADDEVVVPQEPPTPTVIPPFIDPAIAAEEARGVQRVNFNPASLLVVYNQPYGYQFYHARGMALGLVDFDTAGIPGPLGLITSITTALGDFRTDIYYIDHDRVQANLYDSSGNLLQEFAFDVPGIGARAGQVAGQPVPPFPGQAVASNSANTTSDPSVAEVLCDQNMRQGANIDAAVVDVMPPGTALNVVGRSSDNTWLRVSSNRGLTGWTFNGRCISGAAFNQAPVEVVFDNQPQITDGQQQVAQSAAPAVGGEVLVNITCRQNERRGPGTSFAVDRVLQPGTQLGVVGRSADVTWIQLSSGGWTYFGQCVVPTQGDLTAAPVTVALGG